MPTLPVLASSLLLCLAAGCATPLTARVEWRAPDQPPRARSVDFEEYVQSEDANAIQVYLKHEEKFNPWELERHYLGETVVFSFAPAEPGGEAAVIADAGYEFRSYVFFDTVFVEGSVTPVPDDPGSAGDFRLVFDLSNFGEHISTVTITGRLRR